MPLSSTHQDRIQQIVEAASSEEVVELRANAERTLHEINFIMSRRLLTSEEHRNSDLAIEMLTRLDAHERGGGWWFRAKRRVQLVQMYLGS